MITLARTTGIYTEGVYTITASSKQISIRAYGNSITEAVNAFKSNKVQTLPTMFVTLSGTVLAEADTIDELETNFPELLL